LDHANDPVCDSTVARRTILTAAQRVVLLALPAERHELARFWTPSEPELAFLARRRRDRNRLGVGLQLCALRYPGRLLRPAETVPAAAIAFVAEQLGVTADVLGGYAVREPTKYEHSSILQEAFGFRPFEGAARREIESWLDLATLDAASGFELVARLRDELRNRRIIVPAITTLERLCAAALTRSDRTVADRLAGDLSRGQVHRLEALLGIRPGERLSWLGWLRRPVGTASASSYKEVVARIDHLRAVSIEPTRAHRIPAARLTQLAAEGERLSLGHLRHLVPAPAGHPRRDRPRAGAAPHRRCLRPP
jgi:Domain of unknown function (DUF4158)